MVLRNTFKKYDRIVFEPENVFSDNKYRITAAVLAVYELCNSNAYFGKTVIDYKSVFANRKQIFDLITCGGKTEKLFYDFGIDRPEDIAYLLTAAILGLGERRDFFNIYNYFKYIDLRSPDIFEHASVLLGRVFTGTDCKYDGTFHRQICKCCNEWLVGSDLFELCFDSSPTVTDKPGLMETENLCCSLVDLKDLLSLIKESGKQISLCSLRFRNELMYLLNRRKISDLFEREYTVTQNDITESGHIPAFNMPSEPDTYAVARAIIGSSYSEHDMEQGRYDDIFAKSLVVGSTTASLFSAQLLGASFAAVVNNPTDKERKDMFRQLEADYVLGSVLELASSK